MTQKLVARIGSPAGITISPDLWGIFLEDLYVRALRRCASIASEPDATGRGWLEREVARHADRIRASAHADDRKAFSNERFEQEVAWMLSFARQRGGLVTDQVGR